MRITYRNNNNKDYWSKRWADIPIDKPMENLEAYPLKYAAMVVGADKRERILEAGCGAGRLLRYYHNLGYDIFGIDFIEPVIEKLKKFDSSLQVEVGDITNLQFADNSFGCVLAFGLYHNLESSRDLAMKETFRVLKPGGRLCASFRADNLQTRMSDKLQQNKIGNISDNNKIFHKVNLTKTECINLVKEAGFRVENIFNGENMPILYKFKFFRHRSHKEFDENEARKEGYRLSWLGRMLTSLALFFAPDQFCNLYVILAVKD